MRFWVDSSSRCPLATVRKESHPTGTQRRQSPEIASSGRGLHAHLAAAVTMAADNVVVADLLEDLARRELVVGASVYRVPVDTTAPPHDSKSRLGIVGSRSQERSEPLSRRCFDPCTGGF